MAAFTGVLDTFLADGRTPGPSYRFAASDVVAAFVTLTDIPGTPAALNVPLTGLRLADVSVSAVGGTVVALQFTKGSARTDKILRMGRLLETLSGMDGKSRLGALYGMPLQPGAQYGIIQV